MTKQWWLYKNTNRPNVAKLALYPCGKSCILQSKVGEKLKSKGKNKKLEMEHLIEL